MKYSIYKYIKSLLVALLFLLNSCHGEEIDVSTTFSSEQVLAVLKESAISNVTIDSVQLLNEVECFYLSNKTIIKIPTNYAPIVIIGEDGNFYERGGKTAYKWNTDCDILTELRSINNYKINELEDGSNVFLGAKESLSDFLFCFSDGTNVRLSKSLFKYDLDTIMKTINHRGFRTIAPENTLVSYLLARLNGFKYVETDVRFTKDNIPVLIHDDSIDRTSNGRGKVAEMIYEDLKKYDFGSWKDKKYEGTVIPSLEEFLSLCCEIGLSPYLELKTGSKEQISLIVDLIIKYGLQDRTTFISFSSYLLEYVRSSYPKAKLGLLATPINNSTIERAKILRSDSNTVEILSSDMSESSALLCYKAGFDLFVGSIDDPKLLFNLSKTISGVTSNSIHAGWVILNRR